MSDAEVLARRLIRTYTRHPISYSTLHYVNVTDCDSLAFNTYTNELAGEDLYAGNLSN